MANGYSWSSNRERGGYHLPGPDRLGWWAAVAMLLSVLLHVIVFFALDRMKIAFNFTRAEELSTRPMAIHPVEIRSTPPERSQPPEETVKPTSDTAVLMEDIELMDILPEDSEIDIKPDVSEPEYALQMRNPAREGEPDALAMDISKGLDLASDLPELGRQPATIEPGDLGQIIVDPGAANRNDKELANFTNEMIRRGANGKSADGKLDGNSSLDDLLDLPPNLLLGKKTMLPSDLLFEFNSSDLRESAKIGLMKLGLLMDRNPSLYCWIEGHTDLVGGDQFNLDLSIRRAQAVKDYLVKSMRMDPAKIFTRGFGRYRPLVTGGSRADQAANRRVEIRMRNTPPPEEQIHVEPKKAAIVEETPPPPKEEPAPPKAILVKPQRALPVEIVPLPPARQPLKALPVDETPPPPRAQPDFPEVAIPKAAPVELAPAEDAAPPRAEAVK
jgi:outer membrane protein OmpA-like peptidoglycan-associated protein